MLSPFSSAAPFVGFDSEEIAEYNYYKLALQQARWKNKIGSNFETKTLARICLPVNSIKL